MKENINFLNEKTREIERLLKQLEMENTEERASYLKKQLLKEFSSAFFKIDDMLFKKDSIPKEMAICQNTLKACQNTLKACQINNAKIRRENQQLQEKPGKTEDDIQQIEDNNSTIKANDRKIEANDRKIAEARKRLDELDHTLSQLRLVEKEILADKSEFSVRAIYENLSNLFYQSTLEVDDLKTKFLKRIDGRLDISRSEHTNGERKEEFRLIDDLNKREGIDRTTATIQEVKQAMEMAIGKLTAKKEDGDPNPKPRAFLLTLVKFVEKAKGALETINKLDEKAKQKAKVEIEEFYKNIKVNFDKVHLIEPTDKSYLYTEAQYAKAKSALTSLGECLYPQEVKQAREPEPCPDSDPYNQYQTFYTDDYYTPRSWGKNRRQPEPAPQKPEVFFDEPEVKGFDSKKMDSIYYTYKFSERTDNIDGGGKIYHEIMAGFNFSGRPCLLKNAKFYGCGFVSTDLRLLRLFEAIDRIDGVDSSVFFKCKFENCQLGFAIFTSIVQINAYIDGFIYQGSKKIREIGLNREYVEKDFDSKNSVQGSTLHLSSIELMRLNPYNSYGQFLWNMLVDEKMENKIQFNFKKDETGNYFNGGQRFELTGDTALNRIFLLPAILKTCMEEKKDQNKMFLDFLKVLVNSNRSYEGIAAVYTALSGNGRFWDWLEAKKSGSETTLWSQCLGLLKSTIAEIASGKDQTIRKLSETPEKARQQELCLREILSTHRTNRPWCGCCLFNYKPTRHNLRLNIETDARFDNVR